MKLRWDSGNGPGKRICRRGDGFARRAGIAATLLALLPGCGPLGIAALAIGAYAASGTGGDDGPAAPPNLSDPALSAPATAGVRTGADPDFVLTVRPGDSLAVSFQASDGDAEDVLTLTASVAGGSLTPSAAGFAQIFPVQVSGISPATLSLSGTAAGDGNVLLEVSADDGRGGSDSLSLEVVVVGPPVVLSVNPLSGPVTGGTVVLVAGLRFRTGLSATIGGLAPSNLTVISASVLSFHTTPHAAGPVDVVVTNPDGQQGTLFSGYVYVPPPTVTAASPPYGPAAGGTTVTLTGTGFLAGAVVRFGGANAGNVAVLSPTSLTCTTPPYPSSTIDVQVVNPDAQTGTLLSGYTFTVPPAVSGVAPSSGSALGGTPVTVAGSGFLAGASVAFGGASASNVVVVSGSSITCLTPAHAAGTVAVQVLNPDLQSGSLPSAFTFVDFGSWAGTSASSPPSARELAASVWTGREMVVWGGWDGTFPSTGGVYDPAANAWTATAALNAPAGRGWASAVWTGREAVFWGGKDQTNPYGDGGSYDPQTGTWAAVNTGSAPAARYGHRAVWTGSRMAVWGGSPDGSAFLNTGGLYDPRGDAWTATNTSGAPSGRYWHAAVWTGRHMAVWGGWTGAMAADGGRYDPRADTWAGLSTSSAPGGSELHTAVWTGKWMIVWGGWSGTAYLGTGGRYDPAADSWSSVSASSAPGARDWHTASWTGREMIVWGGQDAGGMLGDGGRYDPAADAWQAVQPASAPSARYRHVAEWTGRCLLVWGGWDGTALTNSGGAYAPPPAVNADAWAATTTSGAPVARSASAAVWTGAELIVWGQRDGSSYYVSGGRYDPVADAWTATSTGAGVPSSRQDNACVWTGREMIVWGGRANATYLNDGSRYDPVGNAWAAMGAASPPAAREVFMGMAVWTGKEMVVWGGWDGTTYFNTGGRYDPAGDSWAATDATGAPAARRLHKIVWTGREMIAWGGWDGTTRFNTGGRYDPAADTWAATNTSNAPAARANHAAVWTGREMVVWGGSLATGHTDTGGKYDPRADAWTATTTSGAPVGRVDVPAVWTGKQVVVWGGWDATNWRGDGGRYDPRADSWSQPTMSGAPLGRNSHAMAWTGKQVVVWGGWNGTNYFNTGGRYTP